MNRFLVLGLFFLTIPTLRAGGKADTLRHSQSISVQATDKKIGSGFKVQKGDWLELEIKGKWRMWDQWSYTGPEGHTNFKRINELGHLGVLVCQIGKGKPFPLAARLPFQATDTGVVHFWPNRKMWDHLPADGKLTITIHEGESLKAKRDKVLQEEKDSLAKLQNDPEIRATLQMINQARKSCGLAPVKISLRLSRGCLQHARYLLLNRDHPLTRGLEAHKEYPQLKGYSEEGLRAAKAAVIYPGFSPSAATRGWLASFYHRIPLLHPHLIEVGIGYRRQGNYWISLVDCISGASGPINHDVVFYPANQQTQVPLTFTNEIPQPLPKSHAGPAGFPVTVYFAARQKVTNVTMTLSGPKGNAIAAYVSTPENPATTFTQWNTVCLIPQRPLQPGTRYTTTIRCLSNGQPFDRTWSFTTANR